jgi:hypothetical protein
VSSLILYEFDKITQNWKEADKWTFAPVTGALQTTLWRCCAQRATATNVAWQEPLLVSVVPRTGCCIALCSAGGWGAAHRSYLLGPSRAISLLPLGAWLGFLPGVASARQPLLLPPPILPPKPTDRWNFLEDRGVNLLPQVFSLNPLNFMRNFSHILSYSWYFRETLVLQKKKKFKCTFHILAIV